MQSAANFKYFFTNLDNNIEFLGISSYGVGMTTLEQVFLKIGKDKERGINFEPS